ncbi:hypothetical protein P12x_005075 [Tundrisphaera lichenicola]|uniref:hypothetical protein n=1 Tax=Tundrisphaera lichenicola TaxID=2029860 RepID=UPI003EBD5269
MPWPRITIRQCMIGVAVLAAVLYLEVEASGPVFFGSLPIASALIGIWARRLRPATRPVSARDRILAGLGALAILAPAIALKIDLMDHSGIAARYRIERGMIFALAGAAPLALFCLATALLRRVGSARRAPGSPSLPPPSDVGVGQPTLPTLVPSQTTGI